MANSKDGRARIAILEGTGSIIKQVEKLKYLESTLSQEGQFDAEVESKRKLCGEGGRGEVTRVVCDKKMPTTPGSIAQK